MMKRWMGVLAVVLWCLSGGVAVGVGRGDRYAIVDPLAIDDDVLLQGLEAICQRQEAAADIGNDRAAFISRRDVDAIIAARRLEQRALQRGLREHRLDGVGEGAGEGGQRVGALLETLGKGMVAALRKVLMEKAIPLSTSESTNLVQGYDEASRMGFDYVLKCVITEWEDNATAWSGKGDKLRISIELFDAKSKQLVAAGSHYRIATGFTLVSGSPDRFMDECATGALSQIFGWPQK